MDDNTTLINNQLKNGYYLYNRKTGKLVILDNHAKSIYRLRKRIFSWAQVTSTMKDVYGNYYLLLELSYADNNDWKASQITGFIQETIKYIGVNDVYDYAWVLEVKPIGKNLHYHLAVHCKDRTKIPFPDKSGSWCYGSTNIRARPSSPYYLAKYTSKEKQKYREYIPKGARKQSTWMNSIYYSRAQLMEHKKSAYPEEVIKVLNDTGIVDASISRKIRGGWKIDVKDKLSDLYGCQIEVQSDWDVYKGVGELEIYLPDMVDKLANL